jgi:putative phosphoesterase
MRLLLFADVHANGEALLSLQRAERRPDALLFAGDAVGYGPEPAQCARWLLANATVAVRGNHDQAVSTGAPAKAPPELEEAAAETLDYARRLMTPEDFAGLQSWPLTTSVTLGGARFYLAHGTPADPLAGNLDIATAREADLHGRFDSIDADIILLGHTHQPALRRLDQKLIINPGSLGQPRNGLHDATYAVWDDGRVQIHHLHYNHDATAQRLALVPLSHEVSELLIGILETGLVE